MVCGQMQVHQFRRLFIQLSEAAQFLNGNHQNHNPTNRKYEKLYNIGFDNRCQAPEIGINSRKYTQKNDENNQSCKPIFTEEQKLFLKNQFKPLQDSF